MAAQGKKLINNPNGADVVTEFIEALVETYPGLQYLDGFPEVMRWTVNKEIAAFWWFLWVSLFPAVCRSRWCSALMPRPGRTTRLWLYAVAGGAADAGLALEDVAEEARCASELVGTIGIVLSVCTLPGQETSDRLVQIKRILVLDFMESLLMLSVNSNLLI